MTNKTTSTEDWHSADITAALKKRGISMRKLSIHHGYSPFTLRTALERKAPKYEKLIAEAIGVLPEVIWPSRYRANKSVAEVLEEIKRELPTKSQFNAVAAINGTKNALICEKTHAV